MRAIETPYPLVIQLAGRLQERQWRLCTAESCTGGTLAQVLTDLPGSSQWFECGWVTYSNAAKQRSLGVSEALLAQYGAVSPAVAEAMATGALQHAQANLAMAITGVAGPGGGSAEKPVGLVWFAWAVAGHGTGHGTGGKAGTGTGTGTETGTGSGSRGRVWSASRIFPGDRAAVRQAATVWALQQLLSFLADPGIA
jgi:nicotinamide-nucleotide amidase